MTIIRVSIEEFFNKYYGVLLDDDGYYGGQCMDLYQRYTKEFLGAKEVRVPAAADVWDNFPKDCYERIVNSPTNYPQQGDVVIWKKTIDLPYGHVAICSSANVNDFISFDQNWPLGSVCHFQSHDYQGVAGWLRPKSTSILGNTQPTPAILVITNQTKLDTETDFGIQEWQAIKSLLHDLKRDRDGALAQANDLRQQLKVCRDKTIKPVFTPSNPFANFLYQLAKAIEG